MGKIKTIRALLYEPGKKPQDVIIEDDLEAYQDAVGGPIETLRLSSSVVAICNEEGLIRRLKPCAMAKLVYYSEKAHDYMYHHVTLVGSIIVVGFQGDEFRSLTDEEKAFALDRIRAL